MGGGEAILNSCVIVSNDITLDADIKNTLFLVHCGEYNIYTNLCICTYHCFESSSLLKHSKRFNCFKFDGRISELSSSSLSRFNRRVFVVSLKRFLFGTSVLDFFLGDGTSVLDFLSKDLVVTLVFEATEEYTVAVLL